MAQVFERNCYTKIGVGLSSTANGDSPSLLITSTNDSANNHKHCFLGPGAGTNDDIIFCLNRNGGAYGRFDVEFNGIKRFFVAGEYQTNGGFGAGNNALNSKCQNILIGCGKNSIPASLFCSNSDLGAGQWNYPASALAPSQAANSQIVNMVGRELASCNAAYIGLKYCGDNSSANYLFLGMYGSDAIIAGMPNGDVGIGTHYGKVTGTLPADTDFGRLTVHGETASQGDFNSYPGHTSVGVLSTSIPTPKECKPDLIVCRPFTSSSPPVQTNNLRGIISIGLGVGIYSVNPNIGGGPFYGDIRFYTTCYDTNYCTIDRMTITCSGFIGIGTGAPSYKLEVAAGASTEGLAVTASSGDVYLQTDGQLHGYQKLDVTSAGLQIKGFSDGGGTKTQQARIYLTQAATGARGGEIRFYTDDGSTMKERTRICKNGDIQFIGATGAGMYWDYSTYSLGIGTDSPGRRLSVLGEGNATVTTIITPSTNGGNFGILDLKRQDNAIDSSVGVRFSHGNSAAVTNDIEYGFIGGGIEVATAGSEEGFLNFAVGPNRVERMRITNDGKVGIGSDNPLLKLHVQGDVTGGAYNQVAGQIVISGASNTNKRLNIGFDTSTDKAFLQSGINGTGYNDLLLNPNGGAILINKTSTTGIPGNLTNGTVEVSQITGRNAFIVTEMASGNVAFATASSAAHNYYAGYFYSYNGSTYTPVGYIDVGTTSTSYVTSSDYRLKENVVGITDGITRIKSLKPSRFNFIVNADRTVDGFVAHEVSDIVPEAITGAKDAVDDEGNPQYQGIDQSKLVPLLTAALQEAIAKIEALEARVEALGG